jgi:hypothetical protein
VVCEQSARPLKNGVVERGVASFGHDQADHKLTTRANGAFEANRSKPVDLDVVDIAESLVPLPACGKAAPSDVAKLSEHLLLVLIADMGRSEELLLARHDAAMVNSEDNTTEAAVFDGLSRTALTRVH